jgi:hypothetical protein
MAGGAVAVTSGDVLCKEVVALGERLGLGTREQFKCGRRIWGAERYIDVVLTHVESRRRLGPQPSDAKEREKSERRGDGARRDERAKPRE